MKDYLLKNFKSNIRGVLPFFLLLFVAAELSCAQSNWRKADELFEAMELKEGSWVADVGSREGYYTIRMSPIVGESGHIFAVDINSDALEDLHDNIRERNLENITPVYSIPESPMLPANSLDAILVRNAYHEFTDYMDMLRQIKNALKPGGRFVLAEPIEEELKTKSREEQVDDHDLAIHFAREELTEAGFTIIKEDEEFTSVRRGRQYWLIIAVPDK